MRTLITPIVCKNKRRLIYNEGIYSDSVGQFKKELKAIYDTIPNIQVDFKKVWSDVLNSNFCNGHYVIIINNVLTIAFVDVSKIPPYHSVESIGKSLLTAN